MGNDFSNDALIIAGDISDDLELFAATLRCFTEHWQVVELILLRIATAVFALEVTDWVSDLCSMSFLFLATMICGHERQREAN